jgi:VanZ family protein
VKNIETRWLLLLIPIYAVLLEFGQLFIPGRFASVENFVSSALGAIDGVLVGKGARVLFR